MRRSSALARRAAYEQVDGRITIDGHDVTREIRTPEIDKAAASVARLPHVREVLVGQQRDLGAGGAVVMEGRDIGTVVFPQADLKFYIDAPPKSGRAAAPRIPRTPAASRTSPTCRAIWWRATNRIRPARSRR